MHSYTVVTGLLACTNGSGMARVHFQNAGCVTAWGALAGCGTKETINKLLLDFLRMVVSSGKPRPRSKRRRFTESVEAVWPEAPGR